MKTTFRKVSEESAYTFFFGGSGKFGGNTIVRACGEDGFEQSVSLHGNTIAWVLTRTLHFSLCGWNTPTTKERLNAIFYRFFLSHEVKVFQKKGKLYVSVQNINVELDKENECTNQFVVYLIEPDKTYTLTETIDQKIVYLDEV